jgi:hypothetical protein
VSFSDPLDETLELTLLNTLGTTILTKKVMSGDEEIDLNDLPDGIYLLRCKSKAMMQSYRVVKE